MPNIPSGFSAMQIDERLKTLAAISYGQEKQNVRHDFTEEEMEEYKDKFSSVSITLQNEKELFDAQREQYKTTVVPLEKTRKELLLKISHKYEESVQDVFLVDNQETGMMEIYSSVTAEKISERKLFPSERQQRMSFLSASNSVTLPKHQ